MDLGSCDAATRVEARSSADRGRESIETAAESREGVLSATACGAYCFHLSVWRGGPPLPSFLGAAGVVFEMEILAGTEMPGSRRRSGGGGGGEGAATLSPPE